MSKVRKGIILVGMNLAVLAIFLLVLEVSARAVRFSFSCVSDCDFRYLKNPPAIKLNKGNTGLYRYDEMLGHIPSPNYNLTLDKTSAPTWQPGNLTITQDGFRSNDNKLEFSSTGATIIAVGDSFTFGQEVSNESSWPSCLERLTKQSVLNAGVSGYGAAQSLRRLEIVLKTNTIKRPLAIWSVLVGDDFSRDRFVFRFGFPMPAVISSASGLIHFSKSPPADSPGSVFIRRAPTLIERGMLFLAETFWLAEKAFVDFGLLRNAIRRRTEVHPHAATTKQIIEWSIARFGALDIPKIILLQYGQKVTEKVKQERRTIFMAAKSRGITVVDSYDAIFRNGQDNQALYGHLHHTKLGNLAICHALVESVQSIP